MRRFGDQADGYVGKVSTEDNHGLPFENFDKFLMHGRARLYSEDTLKHFKPKYLQIIYTVDPRTRKLVSSCARTSHHKNAGLYPTRAPHFLALNFFNRICFNLRATKKYLFITPSAKCRDVTMTYELMYSSPSPGCT